ncbi:MAG: glutathione S-transferase family protein [Steroidobacteraceae bacterium]
MYTLYIANKNYSSWSLRPWVLMRALGIPFEERLIPFGTRDAPHDFHAFSPNGKVPCLHDGTVTVWESLAIVEYLAERHDGVWPTDASARAFARSAAAEMHAGFGALRQICSMTCGLRVRLQRIEPQLRADLERLQQLWQDGLGRFGGPFLAGREFSAVDAFFAPVAFRIQTYRPPLAPAALAYSQRLLSLAPMRSWYADALAEPWRDEAHERETLAVGTVTEDLRHPPVAQNA